MENLWPKDVRHWLRAGVAGALARGNVLVINEGQAVVGLTVAAFGHSVVHVLEDVVGPEVEEQTTQSVGLPCRFDSARRLEYSPDESFDTVILGGLSNSERPGEVGIGEAYRLCRPGGRLIISLTSASHGRGDLQSPQELMALLGSFGIKRLHLSPQIPTPWVLAWCKKREVQAESRSIEKRAEHSRKQVNGELVTVLVPTFNRAYLLRRTLDAIYRQSYGSIEVIVVDDGSTDRTAQVVRSHERKPIYIRKPNGGKSSALNAGLREATGEYLWIADDDDLPLPYKLAMQAPLLRANPAACLVYSSCFVFHGSPRNIIGFQSARKLPAEKLLSALLDQELATSRTALYRTSAIKQVGGFDESLIRSQDLDMLFRLARCFPMEWTPFPTLMYRAHAGMRGAAADRFRPEENESKWLVYNQKIYRKVYHEFRLSDLDPDLSDGTDPCRIATALVFRAKVMFKKLLDEYASDDLDRALTCFRAAEVNSSHPLPTDLLENVFEIQQLAILHQAHEIKRKVWQLINALCRLNLGFIPPIIDRLIFNMKEVTGWQRAYCLKCLASFAFGLTCAGSCIAVACFLKRAGWFLRCRVFPVRSGAAFQNSTKSRISGNLFS